MRVIAYSSLREFGDDHANARGPLDEWYRKVKPKGVAWQSFDDLRQDFGSADQVGRCIVFNIGGNNYRLIVNVNYRTQSVFVLHFMTHAEYDKRRWIKDCGCQ